jgi:hypothetical protein
VNGESFQILDNGSECAVEKKDKMSKMMVLSSKK